MSQKEMGDAVLKEELCFCHHFPEPPPTPLPPLPNTPSTAACTLPLVSVVVPTSTERHWAHSTLYACFAHQTYPNLELLVLDTGSKASHFFTTGCDDPRVRYTWLPFHRGLNVDRALENMCKLAQPGLQPPSTVFAYGGDSAAAAFAWREAWRPTLDALA
eukprot:CAMPEP_0119331874 /NCGR_PEP_ID=MMETSP1333-20130426/81583_1 /TAXON_ID=418940 /ORGANISM="Scyphosphaera apsteinii, Strain RCC1455" /LENGTH=159 /DNA_ID=CAMNT_0007341573 /DNA_START=114 /DNA_END=590 /DNA_ORIENTATION=+